MRAHPPLSDGAAPRVLLLHGVWLNAFTVRWLAQRLRAAGFATEAMGYPSVLGRMEATIDAVAGRLRLAGASPLHLVGHSLGGLVALKAALAVNELPPGRIVCLGSPLTGSEVARKISQLPGGSWLLGYSCSLLAAGISDWDGRREVGVIAGRLPFGIGNLFRSLPQPHDGTVSVAETRLPGITQHLQADVTHGGLILSARVARQTAAFLHTGQFIRHGR